ncbi:hypothetical protein KXW39_006955, partial [Aspergillus fumigatus]
MLVQLPPELILLIAANLGRATDISSFARTSRAIYHQLIDFLYKVSQDNGERQPLLWACSEGEERTLELAIQNLEKGRTNIDVYGKALAQASASGHSKIVSTVLQKVKPLLVCDYWVDVALREAARHGHQSVVQLLVGEGADIDVCDPDGTPLIHAVAGGHGDVVELLLKNGASVHRTNKIGRTALHAAACKGDIKTVEDLLKHGAKVDEEDAYGRTALFLAVFGHKDVVEYLLNKGAKAHRKYCCDDTALQVAEEWKTETSLISLGKRRAVVEGLDSLTVFKIVLVS